LLTNDSPQPATVLVEAHAPVDCPRVAVESLADEIV
jgi:hypothetical protein